jgi:4-hydroxyproline epimerase
LSSPGGEASAGGGLPLAVQVVDSHTAGEPTRVVVGGWPALLGVDMAARRDEVSDRWDALRSAVVCEPRGHAAMVGALLTPPVSEGAAAGVVFFNNVGTLGMCGHGMIGLVRTLEHLGRLEGAGQGAGAEREVRVDTPVGTVIAWLGADSAVTIRNVPARVHALDVSVEVEGLGRVTGDVAWGGNWFFIARLPAGVAVPLEPGRAGELTVIAGRIREALAAAGVTGSAGADIDHVELYEPDRSGGADARNFVLCPGGEYDRSPCGTGTSAKLAVLHARGRLAPGERFLQAGVSGGVFTGWLEEREGELVPFIRGHAFITAEATLRLDPADPFRTGFGGA